MTLLSFFPVWFPGGPNGDSSRRRLFLGTGFLGLIAACGGSDGSSNSGDANGDSQTRADGSELYSVTTSRDNDGNLLVTLDFSLAISGIEESDFDVQHASILNTLATEAGPNNPLVITLSLDDPRSGPALLILKSGEVFSLVDSMTPVVVPASQTLVELPAVTVSVSVSEPVPAPVPAPVSPDTTPPRLEADTNGDTVLISETTLNDAEPRTHITFAFDEKTRGLQLEDFRLEGDGSLTMSSGDQQIFTLTLVAAEGVGEQTLAIYFTENASFTDLAGNTAVEFRGMELASFLADRLAPRLAEGQSLPETLWFGDFVLDATTGRQSLTYDLADAFIDDSGMTTLFLGEEYQAQERLNFVDATLSESLQLTLELVEDVTQRPSLGEQLEFSVLDTAGNRLAVGTTVFRTGLQFRYDDTWLYYTIETVLGDVAPAVSHFTLEGIGGQANIREVSEPVAGSTPYHQRFTVTIDPGAQLADATVTLVSSEPTIRLPSQPLEVDNTPLAFSSLTVTTAPGLSGGLPELRAAFETTTVTLSFTDDQIAFPSFDPLDFAFEGRGLHLVSIASPQPDQIALVLEAAPGIFAQSVTLMFSQSVSIEDDNRNPSEPDFAGQELARFFVSTAPPVRLSSIENQTLDFSSSLNPSFADITLSEFFSIDGAALRYAVSSNGQTVADTTISDEGVLVLTTRPGISGSQTVTVVAEAASNNGVAAGAMVVAMATDSFVLTAAPPTSAGPTLEGVTSFGLPLLAHRREGGLVLTFSEPLNESLDVTDFVIQDAAGDPVPDLALEVASYGASKTVTLFVQDTASDPRSAIRATVQFASDASFGDRQNNPFTVTITAPDPDDPSMTVVLTDQNDSLPTFLIQTDPPPPFLEASRRYFPIPDTVTAGAVLFPQNLETYFEGATRFSFRESVRTGDGGPIGASISDANVLTVTATGEEGLETLLVTANYPESFDLDNRTVSWIFWRGEALIEPTAGVSLPTNLANFATRTIWDLSEYFEPTSDSDPPLGFQFSRTGLSLVETELNGTSLSLTPLEGTHGMEVLTVTAVHDNGWGLTHAITLSFEAVTLDLEPETAEEGTDFSFDLKTVLTGFGVAETDLLSYEVSATHDGAAVEDFVTVSTAGGRRGIVRTPDGTMLPEVTAAQLYTLSVTLKWEAGTTTLTHTDSFELTVTNRSGDLDLIARRDVTALGNFDLDTEAHRTRRLDVLNEIFTTTLAAADIEFSYQVAPRGDPRQTVFELTEPFLNLADALDGLSASALLTHTEFDLILRARPSNSPEVTTHSILLQSAVHHSHAQLAAETTQELPAALGLIGRNPQTSRVLEPFYIQSLGDLDRDGLDDFVVAQATGATSHSIVRGSTTFGTHDTYEAHAAEPPPAGTSPPAAAVLENFPLDGALQRGWRGDLDQDGSPDFGIGDRFFLGTSGGGLAPAETFPAIGALGTAAQSTTGPANAQTPVAEIPVVTSSGDVDQNGLVDWVVHAPASDALVFIQSGVSTAADVFFDVALVRAHAFHASFHAATDFFVPDAVEDGRLSPASGPAGSYQTAGLFLRTTDTGDSELVEAGFSFYHASFSSHPGSALPAGDINGDGVDDVLVTIPGRDAPGAANAGAVAVLYGSSGLGPGLGPGVYYQTHTPQLDASAEATPGLGSLGFRALNETHLNGGRHGFMIHSSEAGQLLGRHVVPVGDFNGDGLADVLLGVPGVSGEGTHRLLVYLGTASASAQLDIGERDAEAFQNSFFEITSSVDSFGQTLAPVGDFNGDGLSDFLVGGPEASYLFFGQRGSRADLAGMVFSADTAETTPGGAPTQMLRLAGEGHAVQGLGDINGDGLADVAYGTQHGTFRVLYGNTHYGTEAGEGTPSPYASHAGDDHRDAPIQSGQTALSGTGDDTLYLESTGAFMVDGGAGQDTLVVGRGLELDLTTHGPGPGADLGARLGRGDVRNIETLALYDESESVVKLDRAAVLDLIETSPLQTLNVTFEGGGVETITARLLRIERADSPDNAAPAASDPLTEVLLQQSHFEDPEDHDRIYREGRWYALNRSDTSDAEDTSDAGDAASGTLMGVWVEASEASIEVELAAF